MPKRIREDLAVEARRREIVFTRAALKASPDAAHLLPMTDTWLGANEKLRAAIEKADDADSNADAERAVANAYLDAAVRAFARALEHDEEGQVAPSQKATETARYKTFFPIPPGAFVRLAQAEEADRVAAWLTATDKVVEAHRAPLSEWSGRMQKALAATTANAVVRGEAQMARERTAEDLTRNRDALHAALGEISRAKRYERDWADSFFRIEKGREPKDAAEAPPA